MGVHNEYDESILAQDHELISELYEHIISNKCRNTCPRRSKKDHKLSWQNEVVQCLVANKSCSFWIKGERIPADTKDQ